MLFQQETASKLHRKLQAKFREWYGIGGGERVAPPDPFSLVVVGIYKRPLKSQNTALEELVEAHPKVRNRQKDLEKRQQKTTA